MSKAGFVTLREQIGVALNTSSLTLRPNVETGLERIAALGAAALAIESGADRARLSIAAMQPEVVTRSAGMRALMQSPPPMRDPQDAIVAVLAPMLWHLEAGGQDELMDEAVKRLGEWCAHRPRFGDLTEAGRELVARCVLVEWLAPHCRTCKGSGKQQRSRIGQWLTPEGSMQRNAVFRPCRACNGSGRIFRGSTERAQAMGMSRATFEAGQWGERVRVCWYWIRQFILTRPHRPLTVQLERRRKRV